MIIWLNGAFGAGKTQTAYELCRRLPGSYVYDPENAGFFIRDNLPPGLGLDDFQDFPMWRAFNLDMLDYAASALGAAGFSPYYLYRQKYMSGSFENVGWCRPGGTGWYNIYIMEELHHPQSGGGRLHQDGGPGPQPD